MVYETLIQFEMALSFVQILNWMKVKSDRAAVFEPYNKK